jgi:hypothetical protein
MECTGTDASARSGIDWPIAADDRGCRPAPRRSSTATWSEETAPTEEANPAAASAPSPRAIVTCISNCPNSAEVLSTQRKSQWVSRADEPGFPRLLAHIRSHPNGPPSALHHTVTGRPRRLLHGGGITERRGRAIEGETELEDIRTRDELIADAAIARYQAGRFREAAAAMSEDFIQSALRSRARELETAVAVLEAKAAEMLAG